MAGTEEAADLEVRAPDQSPQGGFRPLEQAEYREVFQSPVPCLPDRNGGTRRGGLKAHPQENHFPVRFLRRDVQAVHGGVYHAHVGPQGLPALEIVSLNAARHPQQIAISGQNHVGILAQPQNLIHHTGRGHTHGTAGAGDQVDLGRQQLAQAGLGDGHGVGAADLHDVQLGQVQGLDGL